ncbi:MAG: hypothetical protein AMXMBFR56_48220 [Polyangiaceae bacterium]
MRGMQRRSVLLALALLGCGGGAPSRLHTLGKPKGTGEVDFQVENRTSAIVNNLYVTESERVRSASREALQAGTAEQAALWGDDRLRSGLESGGKVRVTIPKPGSYDVRAVDRDGREQHVANLRLAAGGRYVLELEEGGWRAPR